MAQEHDPIFLENVCAFLENVLEKNKMTIVELVDCLLWASNDLASKEHVYFSQRLMSYKLLCWKQIPRREYTVDTLQSFAQEVFPHFTPLDFAIFFYTLCSAKSSWPRGSNLYGVDSEKIKRIMSLSKL